MDTQIDGCLRVKLSSLTRKKQQNRQCDTRIRICHSKKKKKKKIYVMIRATPNYRGIDAEFTKYVYVSGIH